MTLEEQMKKGLAEGFMQGMARGRRERIAAGVLQGFAAAGNAFSPTDVGGKLAAGVALAWADALIELLDADKATKGN